MLKNLIITLLSDDKPGVVESIAEAVSRCNGNWLESQLAQLGGKFAGVIRVQLEDTQQATLTEQLHLLAHKGIRVFVDECSDTDKTQNSGQILAFRATGPDRPGIVREISSALAHYQINVERLDTRLSSMPYSGDPLFEAEGSMSIPASLDYNELTEKLDSIANELAMDITIDEA